MRGRGVARTSSLWYAWCAVLVALPTTAPQRLGEPAWHRRARRQRGNARALLRIAAASDLLAAHHSRQRFPSAMPNAAPRGKGSGGGKGGGKGAGGGGFGVNGDGGRWDCRICDIEGNFGWRTRCRECEAYRKKGEGGPLAPSRGPTLAERQVRQQSQAQKQQQREASATERKLRAEVERLQGQLSASKASSKGDRPAEDAGGGGADEGDAEMDDLDPAEAYSTWTEEERRKQIEVSRAGLTYAVGKFGESSAEASSIRDEIASLERASRGAKPFKAHRSLLERRRDRLRTRIRKDEEEIEKVEAERDALQKKLEELRGSVAERNVTLRQVEDELAELIKRALAEGDAAGEAGKQEEGNAAAWSAQAASAALQNLASRPGIPPEFAMLLAHVHKAAVALAEAAGGARGHEHQQQQQQQQQPQQQQQQPGNSSSSSTGGAPPAGGPAADGGGTRAAGATGLAATGQQGQQHQQQQQAESTRAAGATAAGGGGAEGKHGTTPKNKAESEEELLEEEGGGGMDVEVEESIRKLPERDREKLREAIRWGARRRRTGGEGADQGGGREREDRERSPRPTAKQNDSEL